MTEISVALGLLARPRVNRASPQASFAIMRSTILMDEIATALGTPWVAQAPIEAALKAIEHARAELARQHDRLRLNIVELHPEKDDPFREYEEWFLYRLTVIAS